jgi:signal transduction histidine kinase
VASFGQRRFPACFNWSIAPSSPSEPKQQVLSEFDRFGNATTVYGHLLSNAISAVVTMYWISTPTLSSMTLEMNCYITGLLVFANALPLVVEMRVRQNEAAITFLKLLESKKHYVRFISHELRTPLNAAMIGLTMAIDSFTAGTDGDTVDTAELGDTLNDVLHAVSTGVDILNGACVPLLRRDVSGPLTLSFPASHCFFSPADLLSFEKIDSGLLELHREDVPVKEFVKHCISLFEAQAKGLGVTIVVQDPSVAPRRDSFRCTPPLACRTVRATFTARS